MILIVQVIFFLWGNCKELYKQRNVIPLPVVVFWLFW